MVRTWLGSAAFAALFFAQGSASAICVDAEGTEYQEQETHKENPCWICVETEFETLPAGARCGPELWCEQDQVWASECVPGSFQGTEGTVCESRSRGSSCPQGQTCSGELGYCVEPCGVIEDCSGGRVCTDSVCQYEEPVDRPPPPPEEMDESEFVPDMGQMDAGSAPDVGPPADMGMEPSDDVGSANPDAGGTNEPGADDEQGGCSVATGTGGHGVLTLLIGFFFAMRRTGGRR